MSVIDGYEVVALVPDRFEDFVQVLGKGGIGGCWCMYWISPTSAVWSEGARGGSSAPNRDAFREIVQEGPPPGLLAYESDEPVAWCRVMPRRVMLGLANSRYFKTDLETDGVWSLSCFVVRAGWRGKGLTAVLAKAAIEFVREQGGSIVESYPWDTKEKKSDSSVYMGVASTFQRLGFEVVQRRAPHKPMMRLAVSKEPVRPGTQESNQERNPQA